MTNVYVKSVLIRTLYLRFDAFRRRGAVLTKPAVIADTYMIPVAFFVQVVVMYTPVYTSSVNTVGVIAFTVTSRSVKSRITDTFFQTGSDQFKILPHSLRTKSKSCETV